MFKGIAHPASKKCMDETYFSTGIIFTAGIPQHRVSRKWVSSFCFY